jgi:hypothetical protein
MTLVQRGIWLVFVLLPSLLLLLPTSKAVLVWAGAFIQQALLQTWSDKLSIGHISLGPLGAVLPPVLSGCIAGEGALCLALDPTTQSVGVARTVLTAQHSSCSCRAACVTILPCAPRMQPCS